MLDMPFFASSRLFSRRACHLVVLGSGQVILRVPKQCKKAVAQY